VSGVSRRGFYSRVLSFASLFIDAAFLIVFDGSLSGLVSFLLLLFSFLGFFSIACLDCFL